MTKTTSVQSKITNWEADNSLLLRFVMRHWSDHPAGWCDRNNYYIDYSGFLDGMKTLPLEDWPENSYEGYIYDRFEFKTEGNRWNEMLIEALQRNGLFWKACWWYSNRGGYHEFRVPIKYSEEKARAKLEEEVIVATEDRRLRMLKVIQKGGDASPRR